MFIDVHTHIDQHDPSELDAIVRRAREANVGAMVAAGVTVESSERCLHIAAGHPRVFAGVGAHPQDLKGELDLVALKRLEAMASQAKVVAMSEIGLDLYHDTSPPLPIQERVFRALIGIAREQRLPVIWHMRNSTNDTLRVLRDERVWETGGAAHYFQGSFEEAQAVIDLGCKISLAKPLLRFSELQEVASKLSLEDIVLETDAFPQPFKKKRENWTEPRDVPLVAGKLAELHGMDVGEVERVTTENALRLLGARAAGIRALSR